MKPFIGTYNFTYTKDGVEHNTTIDFVKGDLMYQDDHYIGNHLIEHFEADEDSTVYWEEDNGTR